MVQSGLILRNQTTQGFLKRNLTGCTHAIQVPQTSTKSDDTAQANEQKQFDMIFRAKIEKFIECENDLEQGMPKAYSLIYSTYCTTTMQTRIEEHKDFESMIKNDPIKLLEAIQVLMQNPMQARYPLQL
jgi:hypothetical protein